MSNCSSGMSKPSVRSIISLGGSPWEELCPRLGERAGTAASGAREEEARDTVVIPIKRSRNSCPLAVFSLTAEETNPRMKNNPAHLIMANMSVHQAARNVSAGDRLLT